MANILLVEDDSDLIESLAKFLRLEGHRVRTASNGLEGLQRISEERPDLVLCDVEMPVLDGPGMARRMFLRDAGEELIPILLSSGAAGLIHIASQIGTPYLLAKPFTFGQLSSEVARALTERRPPQPGHWLEV